jgi:hypothetical protein
MPVSMHDTPHQHHPCLGPLPGNAVMSAPYIDRAVSALPLLAASSASPIQVRLRSSSSTPKPTTSRTMDLQGASQARQCSMDVGDSLMSVGAARGARGRHYLLNTQPYNLTYNGPERGTERRRERGGGGRQHKSMYKNMYSTKICTAQKHGTTSYMGMQHTWQCYAG